MLHTHTHTHTRTHTLSSRNALFRCAHPLTNTCKNTFMQSYRYIYTHTHRYLQGMCCWHNLHIHYWPHQARCQPGTGIRGCFWILCINKEIENLVCMYHMYVRKHQIVIIMIVYVCIYIYIYIYILNSYYACCTLQQEGMCNRKVMKACKIGK